MQLTLYMLRDDLAEGARGLREAAAEYTEISTRQIGNLQTALLIRQSEPRPPRWLGDLLTIVTGDQLALLMNGSSAALLLVRHRGHRFVLAYGTGRFAIDQSAIQPGFGLRVVANSVAASRVKSADTRGLGGRIRSQRTALASAGPLYELGIEPSEDLVRQLEGVPTNDFANAAAGSDSLRIRIRNFSLARLEEKLDQIIEKYESTEYKKDFEFLDYFTPVNRDDKVLLRDLRATLAEMIRNHSADVDFADPEILEPLQVSHYLLRHGRLRSPELHELDQESVYSVLNQWSTDDPLNITVEAINASGDQVSTPMTLFDYATTEITQGGLRYALCVGQWFVIDQSYLDGVQRRIDGITDLTDTLNMSPWNARKIRGEREYNEAVATIGRRWLSLDRRLFPADLPNQKVEVCDLLTPEKYLICVKRMTKSATLSHLFLQGYVSAQLLVSDLTAYRQRVVESLRELDPTADFGTRDDWTVVYAMATEKPGPLASSLYFFSKVSLDRIARQLRSIGINVAIARIPLQT